MDQLLSDVKILDLTHYIVGPYSTKLLADYGADVIKIERPGVGDGARRLGPFQGNVPHPEKSGLVSSPEHQQAWHHAQPQEPNREEDIPGAGKMGGHSGGELQSQSHAQTGPGLQDPGQGESQARNDLYR